MAGWKRAILGIGLFVVGVAGPAHADEGPLDAANRASRAFNHWMLAHVFDPIARGYDRVVPNVAQTGVQNLFENLGRPRDAVNSLLQGKPARAGRHLGAFLIDSTVGVVGLVDVSGRWLEPESPETLGETLGVYGLPAGPYLVLPLLGESCVRCVVGTVGDAALYPLFWIGGDTGTAISGGSRVLRATNFLARQMPDPPASEGAWRNYEARILEWPPYPEAKVLFFENLALDVAD